MAATPIRPAWRLAWAWAAGFFPTKTALPTAPPPTACHAEPRGVGRDEDGCMPRHVGFSIRGYRPSLPSHHYYGRTTAFAVVMAQNRFSIFCRRKTTERDEEEGRRRKKGGDRSHPKTALATSACSSSSERRNRQVVMLPSDGKRREERPFFGGIWE